MRDRAWRRLQNRRVWHNTSTAWYFPTHRYNRHYGFPRDMLYPHEYSLYGWFYQHYSVTKQETYYRKMIRQDHIWRKNGFSRKYRNYEWDWATYGDFISERCARKQLRIDAQEAVYCLWMFGNVMEPETSP